MFVITKAIPCTYQDKRFLLVNGDLIKSYRSISTEQYEVISDCFGDDMPVKVDKSDFEGNYRLYNKGENYGYEIRNSEKQT